MKLNKIYSAITVAAVALGAVSCSDKVEYNPAPNYSGNEVYFSPDSTEVAIKEGATEAGLPIFRVKDQGELTVELTSTILDENGAAVTDVFTVPSSVSFPAGSTLTYVPVTFEFDDLTPGAEYAITLKIVGDDHTPYGLSEQTFFLSYSPYEDLKRYGGTEMANITLSAFGIDSEVAAYFAKSTIDSRIKYQFGDYNCPELNDDKDSWTWYVNGYNATVIVDTIAGTARWEPMPTGDEGTFGSMLYVTDVYTYVSEINPDAIPDGSTAEDFRKMAVYDHESGLVSVSTIYYTEDRMRLQRTEYMQLPGFKDYSLDFTYLGNLYYNSLKEEAVQIEAYRSEDVAWFTAKLYPGILTTAQVSEKVKEIQADTKLEPEYDQLAVLEYFLREPASAPYTIVGVGYDESGEAVVADYEAFNYYPSVPYRWKSLGYCEYTDVFVADLYGVAGGTWDVEVEQNIDDLGKVRLVNPYKSGNGWGMADPDQDLDGNYFLEVNIANPSRVFIPQCELGIMLNASEGAVYAWSQASEALEAGMSNSVINLRKYWGKMNDKQEVTFPGASLYAGLSRYAGQWFNVNLIAGMPSQSEEELKAQHSYTGDFFLSMEGKDLSGANKVSYRKQVAAKEGYIGRKAQVTGTKKSASKKAHFIAAPAENAKIRK